MGLPDLSGSNIQDTYQRVLHTSGGAIFDGTGSTVPISFSGDNVTVAGTITAQTYVVSESVINVTSGSTIFGNSSDDTHTFTGDITASGQISSSGTGENYLSGDLNMVEADIVFSNDKGLRFENAAGTEFGNILMNSSDNMVYQNLRSNRNVIFRAGNSTNEGSIIVQKGGTSDALLTVGTHKGLDISGSFTASGDISASDNVYAAEVHTNHIKDIDDTGTEIDFSFGDQVHHKVNGITYIRLLDMPGAAQDRVGINEGGADIDLTVNGNNYDNLFRTDADENYVEVSGSLRVTGNGHITASGNIIAPQFAVSGSTGNYFTDGQITIKGKDSTGGDVVLRGGLTGITPEAIDGHIDSDNGFSILLNAGQTGNYGSFNIYNANNTSAVPGVNTTHIFSMTKTGNITSSGHISSSGNVYANQFIGSEVQVTDSVAISSNAIDYNQPNLRVKNSGLEVANGPITASSDISASGTIKANIFEVPEGHRLADFNSGAISIGRENNTTIAFGKSSNPFFFQGGGAITASGNISSSGAILGDEFHLANNVAIADNNGVLQFDGGAAFDSIELGRSNVTRPIVVRGSITGSRVGGTVDISASGVGYFKDAIVDSVVSSSNFSASAYVGSMNLGVTASYGRAGTQGWGGYINSPSTSSYSTPTIEIISIPPTQFLLTSDGSLRSSQQTIYVRSSNPSTMYQVASKMYYASYVVPCGYKVVGAQVFATGGDFKLFRSNVLDDTSVTLASSGVETSTATIPTLPAISASLKSVQATPPAVGEYVTFEWTPDSVADKLSGAVLGIQPC